MTTTDDLNQIQFTVFPNPTSDLIYLELGSLVEEVSIMVFDTFGKNVLNTKPNSIETVELNFASFPPGIYFVKIQSEEGVGEVKIVKE